MTLPFHGDDLLRGDLVYLMRPTDDDVAVFASWTQSIEYGRLLRRGMVYPDSVEGHREWFAAMARDEDSYPFSIRTLTDGALVGLIVIKDLYWQARHCSFFIGIGERADRGRGYGTDAVRVLLRYAFLEMNLNRVGLEVLSYNTGALRAYEKVGFRLEGTLRQYSYRDGVYYDMHLMGMLRDEWRALHVGS